MPKVDKYKALLEKIGSMNLGGGGWWKPPQGTSTIRILPPVGGMDFFFVEVGQHYIGDNNKPFYCPAICTSGESKCPICDVNEELYRAGEKDAAAKFRATRSFFMNIIDRAHPDQGVLKYAPGTTLFGHMTSAIMDPDYGDITDAEEGYDFKVERTGEGKDTKYQGRPVKRSTPLGTDEQMAEWLEAAEDLSTYIADQITLLSYEDLAKKSGVDVFFVEEEDTQPEPPKRQPAKSAAPASRPQQQVKSTPKRAPVPDEDEEIPLSDDEEPPVKRQPSASARISGMMAERAERAKLLKRSS